MVTSRLSLEPEVQRIFTEAIDQSHNFLLSGGAGSGKTYSLVHVIKQLIAENPAAKIACMTYTNAAVREIEERIDHPNLKVGTIHDFLWAMIKPFQAELKSTLIQMMNDSENRLKKPDETEVAPDYFDGKKIDYKEYLLIREGVISHDELIMLAHEMFKTYPKLCRVLKNTYPFILVDEYQDTDKQVIEILLDFLPQQTHVPCVVGLFGDAMQSIYDSGVGDVQSYIDNQIDNQKIIEIKKLQNRRNPRLVYELANKLRTDGIVQNASDDANAPNMENGSIKDGAIRFFHSTGEPQLDALKTQLGWDFSDAKNVKILNLTHNLIATKAGFPELMAIYDKDGILAYKKHITDFIKKKNLNADDFSQQEFGEVIECLKTTYPSDVKKIEPTKGQTDFIQANQALFDLAKSLNFEQFRKIYLDKDGLIDDGTTSQNKQDDLIKHLHKLQHNIWLYETGDYNEFLRKTEYKITRLPDKEKLKNSIDELSHMANKTIGESIEFANKQGICLKDDRLNDFIKKYPYVYKRVEAVLYQEFRNLYGYVSGFTPYSTQHKVKGAEFNKVLVILDNGGWNNYNFQNLFESCGTESVLKRTQKLFYVCCTRAKEELVVYFHEPKPAVLTKAKDWFGELFTVN